MTQKRCFVKVLVREVLMDHVVEVLLLTGPGTIVSKFVVDLLKSHQSCLFNAPSLGIIPD